MTQKNIQLEIRGAVAVVRLTRGAKRNALSDGLILALRDLFENLPATVRAAVLDERGGIVAAEITSARELPTDEKAEFEKSLAALTGKTVNVNYAVDPDIIGGVVTRIGSTVYDGSVKTKLENLREQLISG